MKIRIDVLQHRGGSTLLDDEEGGRLKRVIALILLVIILPRCVLARETAERSRKKVGIALSGGGALGLAHIGVLRYFEEHRIPVDFVAGTSMGGLIGAIYATGLPAKELESIARETDWNQLLRVNPRFQDRPVAEKQEWNRISGSLAFRFGKKLGLPSGINAGQPLALFFSRFAAPYSEVQSFDELPIPFQCVATDLVEGTPFVLSKGSLPLAMRATMAIPGAFTPVKWQGRVLVDGGLVDNIPTDVVKDMGAEAVIAVSLNTPPAKASNLNSLPAILGQVASIAVAQNERLSLKLADTVVPVQISGITGLDYSRAGDLITIGYEAAKASAYALEKYSVPQDEWEEYVAQKNSRRRTMHPPAPLLSVRSSQATIQRDATDELNRKLPEVESIQKLDETLTGITAATSLPSAYYGWKGNQSGGFSVSLEERPSRELVLRPSLYFQLSSGEPSTAVLRINATAVAKDAYKSRTLAEMRLGYDPGIRLEYYNPIRGTPYFYAPGVILQRRREEFYVGPNQFDNVQDRFAGTLYGGVGTWRFVQMRAGFMAGYDNYERPVTVDGVTAHSSVFINPEVVGIVNTQDSADFPTRGVRLNAAVGYSARNHSYPYLTLDSTNFHPLSKGFGIFQLARVDTSFGQKLNFYDRFTYGGQGQLSAYRYQEFRANTLYAGGGGLTYRIPSLQHYSWKPALATWYQAGRFDLGSQGWATHQSTSLGGFLSTPLGVAGLTLSANEDGKLRVRFSLGAFQ